MAKLNSRQRITNAAVDNYFNVSDRGTTSRGNLYLTRGDVSIMVNFVANGTRISYADANRGDLAMWDAFITLNGNRSFIANHDVANQVIALLNSDKVV